MNKIITIFLIALATSSCARMQRANIANKAQTNLIGMSKLELYECAGTPSRKEVVEGVEFLTYVGGGDRTGHVAGGTSNNAGGGAFSSNRRYCEATFIIKDNKVSKINYSGRTGGWISKGEQCAFIVQNCVR